MEEKKGAGGSKKRRRLKSKSAPPSRKKPSDDDSDDNEDGGDRLVEEVYLRCHMPHCGYEEVCGFRNGLYTFSEYYCPRCGHFLAVLTRMPR